MTLTDYPAWVRDLLADGPALYSLDQLAELRHVSRRTVQRDIERGLVPHVIGRQGGRTMIPRLSVASYLAGLEREGVAS